MKDVGECAVGLVATVATTVAWRSSATDEGDTIAGLWVHGQALQSANKQAREEGGKRITMLTIMVGAAMLYVGQAKEGRALT